MLSTSNVIPLMTSMWSAYLKIWMRLGSKSILAPIKDLAFKIEHLQEIELFYLAHLSVYCIISCLEAPAASLNKKRQRHTEMDDVENLSMNASKIRKLGDNSDSSCSNDFILDPNNQMQVMSIGEGDGTVIKDSMQQSIQYIFKVFKAIKDTSI
uniref:Uncharacterized protein n=1 Tax=Megaselia scalaris TaxID=36166 RepID=T1GTF8_MEGSC